MNTKSFKRWIMLSTLLAWVLVFAIFTGFRLKSIISEDPVKEVSYAEFLQSVANGEVDTVYYSTKQETMTYTLYNEETRGMSLEKLKDYEYSNKDKRITLYPGHDEFRKELLESGVKVELVTDKSIWLSVIGTIMPYILLFTFMIMMNKAIVGKLGTRGVGNSIIETSNKKFSDVIGHDEVIEDIKFAVELLKNPKIGEDMGVRAPKGLLLIGPPGSGKTLIAKAIAGEAGVPFLQMAGSDFKELYVGNGAKKVRELFELARKNAPCVVFIDELDSLGKSRAGMITGSEDDQTVAAMLKEMDGFKERSGIFVIGATNYETHIDEALIRSGRFDRQVYINPPTGWITRRDMFKHFLRKTKLSDDVNLDNLAKQCVGFTGADIEVVANEAGIVALMNGKHVVDMTSIEEAMDKKIFKGNRSKKKGNTKEREIVAYHEAGHVIASWLLGEEIARVSIQASTGGVGGAVFGADKDTSLITKSDIIHRVKVLYGGRASEEIKFKEVSSGASADIQQATKLIERYIKDYGFDEEFGLISIPESDWNSSSDIQERVLDRQIVLSNQWYEEIKNLLFQNYGKVEILATKLLECESLSGEEVYQLLNM